MHCPYCNQEHADTEQFCEQTGKPLGDVPVPCPCCQRSIPHKSKFCPFCGCSTKTAASPAGTGDPKPGAQTQETSADGGSAEAGGKTVPDAPSKPRRAWLWLSLGVILLAALAAAFYFYSQRNGPAAAADAPAVTSEGTGVVEVASGSPEAAGLPMQPASVPSHTVTSAAIPTATFTRTSTPTRAPSATPRPSNTPLPLPPRRTPAGLYPCIASYDRGNKDLKLSCLLNNSWVHQVIDYVGEVGLYPSLAADSQGNPHVAYFDQSNGDLKYARWDGQGWVIAPVDQRGQVGEYPSLALDGFDQPVITYFDRSESSLYLARLVGEQWEYQIIDRVASPQDDPRLPHTSSLVLDGQGTPLVAYYDAVSRSLKFARIQGETIEPQVIDAAGDAGRYCSLALDPSNNQGNGYTVAYYNASQADLMVAAWNGKEWVTQAVDRDGEVGAYASLAIDTRGKAHITYFDEDRDDVKYASWDGRGWVWSVVETTNSKDGISIALDANEVPWIAIQESRQRNLRVAYLERGFWVVSIIDEQGEVGLYPSLKFFPEY